MVMVYSVAFIGIGVRGGGSVAPMVIVHVPKNEKKSTRMC